MRALVLSGGGPLAVAWESGLLAGLAEAGTVPTDADFILGTSAGAIVGAQLTTGRSADALAAAIVDEEKGVPPPGARHYDPAAIAQLPALFAKALAPGDRAAARAEVGAHALAAQAPAEADEMARVSRMLGGADWSDRGFGCVAVDVEDGEVRVLTRDSGASLAQAVAASCSLPGLSPPITIQGRRYMDGGFGSVANADLMLGYDKVLVMCFRPAGAPGDRMAARLDEQVAKLRASGAMVDVVFPDAATQDAIGFNTMDVRRRPAVARAGMAQGRAEAARLAGFLS
jgi:NTE family protein